MELKLKSSFVGLLEISARAELYICHVLSVSVQFRMTFLVSFQSLTDTALLRPLTLVSCSAKGGSSTYLSDNAYYEPTGQGSTDKQDKLHHMASNTLLLKTESIC